MEVKEGKKEAWAVRCEGGPFDGRDAFLGIEPQGKLVRIYESILVGNGQLMHDENVDDLLPGDAVYEEVMRSQLPELTSSSRPDLQPRKPMTECYCKCGGRGIPAPEDQEPGVNYGRLLIRCRCCDGGNCPEHHNGWKCPMCDEDGFDDITLGPHMYEKHPISDEEMKALDASEGGVLEGPLSPELEVAMRKAMVEHGYGLSESS